jgi:hypothetical protein
MWSVAWAMLGKWISSDMLCSAVYLVAVPHTVGVMWSWIVPLVSMVAVMYQRLSRHHSLLATGTHLDF